MAHPTGGFGARAPISARLRAQQYQAPLAHRRLNHEWPEVLRRYWYSANAAEAAYMELEEARLRDQMHSLGLAQLVDFAYENWQRIEAYAAPIVAAIEASQQ